MPKDVAFATKPQIACALIAAAFLTKLAADLRRATWNKPNETSPSRSIAA